METEEGRGRKKGRHPETYANHIRKQRRSRGQSYSPRKRKGEKPKDRTPAKKIKLLCPNSCKKKCYLKFTEEERQIFFEYYWKMGDSQKQKQFVANNITLCDKEIKRNRSNASQSRNLDSQQ